MEHQKPWFGFSFAPKKCNSGTRKPQILEHQSHQFWSTKNTISGTPRPHFWNIKTRAGFSESQVFFFVVFSISACWMTKSTPSSGWGSCEALGPEAREPFWQRYRRLAHEGAMSLVMKVQIDIIDIAMSAMLPSDYHQVTIRLANVANFRRVFCGFMCLECAMCLECSPSSPVWMVRAMSWRRIRRKRNKPIFDCSHYCACEETSMFIINFSWENLWT